MSHKNFGHPFQLEQKKTFLPKNERSADATLAKLLNDYNVQVKTEEERIEEFLQKYPQIVYDYGSPFYFQRLYPKLPDEAFDVMAELFSKL
jgi:hypothetical protein